MKNKSLALLILPLVMITTSCKPHLDVAPPTQKEHVPMADGLTPDEIAKAQLTPEVLWKMGRLGSVELSPDRTQVLYTVTHVNLRENKSGTRIYLQGVADNTARLLVEGASSPQWCKGGNKIVFLKNVEGLPQLFELSLDANAQPRYPSPLLAEGAGRKNR